MFNPVSGTTVDFIEETTNTGGSAPAKYMTKPILLKNESTALDIRVSQVFNQQVQSNVL